MFQWKAFQFFDKELVKEVGTENPHQLIQKLDITCSTSGRGNLIFGDAEGFLNIVDRDFKIYSFQAYKRTVTHILQLKQSNILVTVGDDEESISPTLKVWNLDKSDKAGNPLCLRVVKVQSNPKAAAVPVTCLASLEDLSQLAIGLCNGIVLLFFDIAHERVPKQAALPALTETPVTGLGFLTSRDVITLFVVTTDSVVSYRTTGRITKEELDDKGCELGCAVMGDEHDLSVGRKEAVYFYEQEGRGPCFAFEGEKKLLSWFRSYLIVVCQDPSQAGLNILNIYDLKNKFIAFSSSVPSVSQIVSEWGSIFVLTRDGLLFQLEEKDTQTKLEMLFKKSLYSVAIELAHSQQYDYNSIIDIFTKYGDHLYGKGDYDGAVHQYIHTIGRLEASYVIRKFLDAQRIHNLTLYLQALHKAGLANADHTTLLLNCYTKLKDVQKLDEFIKTDSEWKFEVETAIKVCRQAGYHDHALFLAKKHSQHDWYLKILLEDLKNHENALDYISTLAFSEAEKNLKKYGKALVTALPEHTTNLLMQLCTNYKPKAPKGILNKIMKLADRLPLDSRNAASEMPLQGRTKAMAEEFIHIFVNQPEWLTKFLEFIITQGVATPPIYNTLLELYLREDGATPREDRLGKALSLLRDPRAQFDEDHALVLAQMHDFKAGILHIYEKLKLYHEILQYHMENNDHENVIATCKMHGDKEPNLWVQALSYLAGKEEDAQREITEVLLNIDQANLLPPLVVIQVLATKSTATLSVIKDYIMRRLSHENLLIAEDEHQIRNYSEETEKMRSELEELRTGARIFQLNKCTLCTSPLDLPAVHFLCMHSFHQRCLGENEKECPICAPNNRKIFAMKKSLQDNSGLHEQFFKQLEGSGDGFQAVAEYFGRGIFDTKL